MHYKKVRITKPLLSRPASSERYLLCEDFLGIDEKKLEELYTILEEWVKTEPNIGNYL